MSYFDSVSPTDEEFSVILPVQMTGGDLWTRAAQGRKRQLVDGRAGGGGAAARLTAQHTTPDGTIPVNCHSLFLFF